MQRDLFKADVLTFPLARTAEVRRMARFLAVVHGHFAERYYAKRCRQLAKQMRAAGIPHSEIRRQIQAFQEAVQVELKRVTEREERCA